MARKRMIDPEFWSDEEIGKWSHPARLFYIGLWNFADDEGRFKAPPLLLKSQIFPYDRNINIDKLKTEISNKIKWYNCNGSIYGYIKNFLKYQRIDRPTESKLPIPDEFDEDSSSNHRELDPNIREVKRSKEKALHSLFQALWEKYPEKGRHKQKLAELHYKASVKSDVDMENIDRALENYIKCDKVKGGYVQNASTWFNDWPSWVHFKEEPKVEAEW